MAIEKIIKLRVDTDKKKVDDLIASMGDIQKQKDIIESTPVNIDVKLDDAKAEESFLEIRNQLKELPLEQRIDVVINAANSADSIGELRAAQQELQFLLTQIEDTGSEAYTRVAFAAGQTKDRVNDAKEAVDAFGKSNLENLASGFGRVKDSILSLNFVDFNKQVNLLGQNAKKVSFKELASEIGNTGKSFLQLGKLIASNPIGLLATVVTLIVSNFDTLKNTVGKLFSPFEFLSDIVGGVIQVFKDLGDALGLTSFAVDEFTDKSIKASQKRLAEIEKNYDREIAVARAAGKDVTNIENQKTIAISRNTLEQIRALEEKQKIVGTLTQKEIEQLSKLKDEYYNLNTAIEVNRIASERSLNETIKLFERANQTASQRVGSEKEDQLKDAEEQYNLAKQTIDKQYANSRLYFSKLDELDEAYAEKKESILRESSKKEIEIQTQLSSDRKKILEERVRELEETSKQVLIEEAVVKLKDQQGNLQVDTYENAKLFLSLSDELLDIEQKLLLSKLSSGKITITQYNEEKAAVKERYDQEEQSAKRLIDTLQQEKSTQIQLDLVSTKYDATIARIREDLLTLEEKKIMISADGSQASQEIDSINKQISSSQDSLSAVLVAKTQEVLTIQLSTLEQEKQKKIELLSVTESISEEERNSILKSISQREVQINQIKTTLSLYSEYYSAAEAVSNVVISGTDKFILSEVQRIKALQDEGKAITDVEAAFLSLNENSEIDIKLKFDQAKLAAITTEIDSLINLINQESSQANPDFIKLDGLKAQLAKAQDEFLTTTKNIADVTKKESANPLNTAFATAIGVNEEQAATIANAAYQSALSIFNTLAQSSFESQQRQIEEHLERVQDGLDREYEITIDSIDRRLSQGQISERKADELKAQAEKKKEQELEKARKEAVQKEKKLKRTQAAIEFAAGLVSVFANAFQLGPIAGPIVGALQAAALGITYANNVAAINAAQYAEGGEVPESGYVDAPSHANGGKKYHVRATNTFAELEGGEFILKKSAVKQNSLQKLHDLNAGKIKLFQNGGMVASTTTSLNSSGSGVVLPQNLMPAISPIGYDDQEPRYLSISDLDDKKSVYDRSKSLVKFR